MAVNIITEPSAEQHLGNDNEWEFLLTSAGTPPEVKQLAYQIQDDAGNPISAIEIVPYTGQNHTVDVTKDLERLMIAQVPFSAIGHPSLVQGEEALGLSLEYKIAYGEATTNTTTCITTTDISNLTSVKKIINSYKMQHYDLYDTVFTSKPYENTTYIWQDDWIMLYNSSVAFIIKVFHTTDGIRTQAGTDANIGAGVHLIGCGGRNVYGGASLDGVDFYEIEIYADPATLLDTFKFTIDRCEQGSYQEIIWREPIGGWSSIGFENSSFGSSRGQVTTLNRALPADKLAPWPSFYSTGVIDNQTDLLPSISFEKELIYRDNMEVWLWGLQASNNVFASKFLPAGTKVFTRLNVVNKNAQFKNKETVVVSIQGALSTPLLTHPAY